VWWFNLDFSLTEEQKLFKKTIREFCEKEIKPLTSKIDQEEYFPYDVYKKMGQMGLMGMTIPQEYGGAGIDRVSYMIALEEVSRVCGSTGLTVEAHNTLGNGYLYEKGMKKEQKNNGKSISRNFVVVRLSRLWLLLNPMLVLMWHRFR